MPILVAPEELCSMKSVAFAMRDDEVPQAIAAPAEMAAKSRRVTSGMQTAPAAFRFSKISCYEILVKCIMLCLGISYLDDTHGHGSNPHLRGNRSRTQLQPSQRNAAPLAAGNQPAHRIAGARIRHSIV